MLLSSLQGGPGGGYRTGMSEKAPDPRKERLAEQLRANLHRRKAQARGSAPAAETTKPDDARRADD